jgi:hypothetical protein
VRRSVAEPRSSVFGVSLVPSGRFHCFSPVVVAPTACSTGPSRCVRKRTVCEPKFRHPPPPLWHPRASDTD